MDIQEPMIFMETPRLIIRQWKSSDYEPFIQLNMDKEVMEFFPSTKTREQTLAQVERIINNITKYGYGFFAVERKDNGEFIGFTGLTHPWFESYFTPCVEVGWRLSCANWNQGFATEAAKASLQFGFDQLKLNKIYSFTAIDNKRSEQVMIKTGMIKEGLFDHPALEDGDRLKQHVLYKITREDFTGH